MLQDRPVAHQPSTRAEVVTRIAGIAVHAALSGPAVWGAMVQLLMCFLLGDTNGASMVAILAILAVCVPVVFGYWGRHAGTAGLWWRFTVLLPMHPGVWVSLYLAGLS